MYRKLIFVGVLLILLVPGESNTSLFRKFLKFAEGDSPDPIQMPPSPSPIPSVNYNSSGGGADKSGVGRDGNGQVPPTSPPKEETIGMITDEKCGNSSSKWCQHLNMTACLLYAGSGPEGSFLIVHNDEENSLKANLTFLPQNTTFRVTELQKHQATKINISAIVEGSQSLVLKTGKGDCVIQIGSPAPEDNSSKQSPSGATYVNPMHGAYLLVLIVLITGGAWACLKLRKRGRHLDGVPYQELEMGKPESLSATNVETAEGWDQDWDDDWDEEKAVKSPGGKHFRNGRANGLASRSSNGDGWGNDWDD